VTNQALPFTALGDPTRRAIFAVSQHLKVLKGASLVVDRAVGSRRIYQLDPDGLDALRAYLDQFWNRSLTAFKAAVEQAEEED
jgi:hypothetical protein